MIAELLRAVHSSLSTSPSQLAQMEFEDPDYDANFEFDAPRYYDFESMNEGTPGDKWFETAPDGPGCKADKSKSLKQHKLGQSHNLLTE